MGPVWVATFAYYGGTRKESRSIITRVDAIMWNVLVARNVVVVAPVAPFHCDDM